MSNGQNLTSAQSVLRNISTFVQPSDHLTTAGLTKNRPALLRYDTAGEIAIIAMDLLVNGSMVNSEPSSLQMQGNAWG